MAGFSLADLEALPRVSAVTENDEIILRQGNQLVRIALRDFLSGIGDSGTFTGGAAETVTVENGIITSIVP